MKFFLAFYSSLFCLLSVSAQSDSTDFRAYLYNNEYKVFMRINFYDEDVTVPGQELFGQMPGYLSREGTSYCWLVVAADMKGRQASLQMANDYGSEDLEAVLTRDNDSIYTLRQTSGSTLKVPNSGKWLKLPKTLTLKRMVRPSR